jgi:hypothetical protein
LLGIATTRGILVPNVPREAARDVVTLLRMDVAGPAGFKSYSELLCFAVLSKPFRRTDSLWYSAARSILSRRDFSGALSLTKNIKSSSKCP